MAAANCHFDLHWDYDRHPAVGLFRVYVCQTSGGYSFGQPFYQHPCGYRAIEPSPQGSDTEMTCEKLQLSPGHWFLVVTAASSHLMQESGPSKEIEITLDGVQPIEPPRPDVPKVPELPDVPKLPDVPDLPAPKPPKDPTAPGWTGGISETCIWRGVPCNH